MFHTGSSVQDLLVALLRCRKVRRISWFHSCAHNTWLSRPCTAVPLQLWPTSLPHLDVRVPRRVRCLARVRRLWIHRHNVSLSWCPPSLLFCFLTFRALGGHVPNPNGAAAFQFLADSRAARIRGERASRPAPTVLEQQAAREERARLRARNAAENVVQRDPDEFMSTASVYSTGALSLHQL